jgi:hypothetical protein
LKLLSISEEDLENEIKIMKAINKNVNMNFGLEKCAKICLKLRRVQRKTYAGRTTLEKDIKELGPRKALSIWG